MENKDAIKNTYAFFIARLFAGYKKCQRHIYKVEIVKDFNSVTESPTKITKDRMSFVFGPDQRSCSSRKFHSRFAFFHQNP